MKMIFRCAAVVAGVLLATPAWASHVDHDDEIVEPFRGGGPIADRSLPPQAKAGSGRYLSLGNANGLREHSWAINLPGKGRLIAERKRQRESGDGRTLNWIGAAKGTAGGLISITKRDDLVSGFIDDGKRYWVIESAGQGLLRLYEIDASLTPPPAPPIAPSGTTGEESTSSSTQSSGATVAQDVLIAYSPEVTTRYGGVAATETAIVNHVAAVNQSYSNSGVDIQLNLVGTVELSQSQSNNMSTTLSRLKSTSDGWYDEVHPLRDQLGADLVAMLSTETGYCGIAYLNKPQFSGEDAWAFSVTSAYQGYTCLPLTLAHEIGHNQGLCHNREETGCTNPAYAYGFGYRVCGSFRTVMSYSCSGATRIYHFANPSVFYAGQPTGIAHASDPGNSSEAARALNDSAADVAAWRGCGEALPPAAPVGSFLTVVSHEQIDLEWGDNSGNESGFDIERSGSGQGWTKIASVGASGGSGGTMTYADQGLDPETSYTYRVQAVNCAGASDFDVEVNASTDPLPAQPPAAPSAVSATAESNGDVTVSWSVVANADSYDIGRAHKTGKGNKWSAVETIAAGVAGPSFTDVNPGNGTYRYYVLSNNEVDSSGWSSHAQVTVGGGGDGGGGPNCARKPDHAKCQGV